MTDRKKKRPVRILFGAVDIGYRIELYTKFIRQHFAENIKTESLTISLLPKEHYSTFYDYEFHFAGKNALYRWSVSLFNFLRCLFRYDMFHFFSGETLLPRKLRRFELMMYKLFGKKVIMHFVGCDIRSLDYSHWKAIHIQEYLSGVDAFPKSESWQQKLIKDAVKYADTILVSTPDLKEIIPQATYFPVLLDLDKYLDELNKIPVEKSSDEITILHSPSNLYHTRTKGTDYIIPALKQVAAMPQYKVRLILPSEKDKSRSTPYSSTRYELFKHFKEADIVIDQLITGWYGLLSVEALAAGKEVICYVDEHLKPNLFPGCPIEIANVNNLEEVIIKCIEKIRTGKQSSQQEKIDWVRKYHTIEKNNEPLLRAWNIN
jgi:hypothetical protein